MAVFGETSRGGGSDPVAAAAATDLYGTPKQSTPQSIDSVTNLPTLAQG